jgi:hypothetical protein
MAPITHSIAPFRGLQCNVRAPVVSEAPTGDPGTTPDS